MNSRIFPGSAAIGFGLAAALAYSVTMQLSAEWLAWVFVVLALTAGFYAIGFVAESIALMVELIQSIHTDIERERVISADRDLLLAEKLTRMPSDALAVFRQLAGAQYDPYDPQSVVLPGFALLTKAFAIAYFASCGESPALRPVRAYSEGRSDRQREQAGELIDWLVVEGYARRTWANSEASWMNARSAGEAMARLGLVTEDDR